MMKPSMTAINQKDVYENIYAINIGKKSLTSVYVMRKMAIELESSEIIMIHPA